MTVGLAGARLQCRHALSPPHSADSMAINPYESPREQHAAKDHAHRWPAWTICLISGFVLVALCELFNRLIPDPDNPGSLAEFKFRWMARLALALAWLLGVGAIVAGGLGWWFTPKS
jgi:hypothetical protein